MKKHLKKHLKKPRKLAVQVTVETNIDEIIKKAKELRNCLERANSLIREIASTDLEIGIRDKENMFEEIERIIVETEEGEEIATIINDDEINQSIIVADGYTVRIKPKAI